VKSYDELKALIEQRGVHAEFGDTGEGWGIEQNPHELASFLVRMQELNVQSVLEIGTGYKGGLSRFLAHDMGWNVTSIDIEDYGHTFEGVTYINLDNVSDDTVFDKFDLVFIDGNHAYETTKADYMLWGEFAGKAIAFHDILGQRDCMGVRKFWLELSGNPKSISTRNQVFAESQSSGIGWIEL
jgi:hypothetical protein